MKKETLTLSNIAHDLRIVARHSIDNAFSHREAYAFPLLILAALLCFVFKKWLLALPFLAVAGYHIYHFVLSYKENRRIRLMIDDGLERGEISIGVEKLSSIHQEEIYEPHHVGRRAKTTKIVTFYYFESGIQWRVPSGVRHYAWSREYYISSKGLENISISGDEFYYVVLQGTPDIAYIYPCKNFLLDATLQQKTR
jgi:hypothetical protein